MVRPAADAGRELTEAIGWPGATTTKTMSVSPASMVRPLTAWPASGASLVTVTRGSRPGRGRPSRG